MYKKLTNKNKVTRYINENHFTDNYLTKDISENISLAITHLNGILENEKIANERIYYFLAADVDFIVDGEKVHFTSGDILYTKDIGRYSAKGKFDAIVINVPAFGVIKND